MNTNTDRTCPYCHAQHVVLVAFIPGVLPGSGSWLYQCRECKMIETDWTPLEGKQ